MARTTVRLESDIPGVIARSGQRAELIVAKTGLHIEAGAKERAPVDTGNLKSSIAWTPGGPFEGEVLVGAWYGMLVEGGSVHPERAYRSREGGLDVMDAYTIAPRPFFAPAVEDARTPFEAAVAQLFD